VAYTDRAHAPRLPTGCPKQSFIRTGKHDKPLSAYNRGYTSNAAPDERKLLLIQFKQWKKQSMARPDKISRFLPICFQNGTKVRRFAKHCPRCHAMVGADDMNGLACLMDNKIFVSARGHCPACNKRFSIACVITEDRHVHRILIPDLMFAIWLRLAVRNQPQPVRHHEWELSEAAPAANRGLVLSSSEPLIYSEQVLGQFDGVKISSWIEYQGKRYDFLRAAPPGGLTLGDGDLLFDGKLIYHLNPAQQA
jgi:hypothetical protein